MDHVPGGAHPQPSGFAALLRNRRLLIFAAAMVAFHLANAAMLPLVGQVLALQNKDVGTALMSACVVAAQLVMVPVAYLAGAKADSWGRKRIFLIGFAFLTARGFLYTLSDNPYWLVGVQILDGVGAGIFGALFPLVVQDLTHGTGRFNVSLGALTSVWGVGAALSRTSSPAGSWSSRATTRRSYRWESSPPRAWRCTRRPCRKPDPREVEKAGYPGRGLPQMGETRSLANVTGA